MNSRKNLAAQVAGLMAIATLVGTSAFAETRHRDATERDLTAQTSDRRESRDDSRRTHDRRNDAGNQTQTSNQRDAGVVSPAQSYDRRDARNNSGTYDRRDTRNNSGTYDRRDTRNNSGTYDRRDTRNNGGTYDRRDTRNNGTYDSRSQAETYRNRGNDRSQSYGYHNSRPAYDDHGRRNMSIGGRVSRFEHERGGYRIWVDGGRYPVWIPEARISLFPRLRIGLSLNFGGYYDPRGYLEAYDYYNDGYGYGSGYGSSGLLRGVVETVDYRRGTLVLRDDVSGSFVTTLIRDRRLESLRPGDYAEIAGDWTRSGVFEGLRLEDERGGRY
jgi:hypothetical protein